MALPLLLCPDMTRRSPKANATTRQRKAGTRKSRRVISGAPSPAASIERLGFTCFRMVATYDPELRYVFRRLMETRATMGVFMRA